MTGWKLTDPLYILNLSAFSRRGKFSGGIVSGVPLLLCNPCLRS